MKQNNKNVLKMLKLNELKKIFKKNKKEIYTVLGLFLLWRGIIALIAFIAQNRFNIQKDTAFGWISDNPWIPDINPFVQVYARWDSGWYYSIIERGYTFETIEQNANIVFFPLYPLLTEMFGKLTGGYYLFSGAVISSLALAGAVLFLYFLAKLDTGKKSLALLSVLFLLLYPYAFFHVAVYTESLFLLLVLASFYFARKKNWMAAGVCAALASATRPTGIIMGFILVIEYLEQIKFSLKKVSANILWLLISPLGLIMHMGYLFTTFGDPLLFMHAQNAWGRKGFSLSGVFEVLGSQFNDFLALFTNPTPYYLSNGTDFLVFALIILIGVYTFFKFRKSYGAFMIISILIPVMTQSLVSIGRYSTVLFPLFILLAMKVKKQPWNYALIILFSMLSTLSILMFVQSYWLG